MTGFMKTASILCNPMTHIHVHFTIPKGLTIERNKKNTKQREKEDKREERKKKRLTFLLIFMSSSLEKTKRLSGTPVL